MVAFIFATGALLLAMVSYGLLEPRDDQVATDDDWRVTPIMEAIALSFF
jgi:hypothetical protein